MWLRRLFARHEPKSGTSRPLYLHNSLGNERQRFIPHPSASAVRMYNCGPTVYDTSHLGNLRSYVFADILRRTLEYNGLQVRQVINITDFGHLSSDGDSGKDKMSTALKREGMPLTLENMRSLAEKYTQEFMRDLSALNIDTSEIQFPRASDYVPAQIAMIHALEEKGYTYRGSDGVYFDSSRFPAYGALGSIDIKGLRKGARVAASDEKKSPTDFLLWKSDKKTGWDSPWGKGFPGWHIECSAMIRKTLGEQIDIHTGGIDLMPTHHNNEIAQSESATGKRPFSRFWLHHEFLNLEKEKISKSVGNVINLPTLIEKGFHPLAYRYFLLGAHYRTAINFSWGALEAAQTAYVRLRSLFEQLPEGGTTPAAYQERFHERINDDLDTPGALAVLWEMTGDDTLEPADIRAGLEEADRVLGLGLATHDAKLDSLSKRPLGFDQLPDDIRELIEKRDAARSARDWSVADSIRDEISTKGYEVDDTMDGTKIYKK